jgi:hypothetical protein
LKIRRPLGYFFITAAAVGFILCIAGLFEIWRYRPVVTQTVVDTLALFDQALNATQDGLTIVGQLVQTSTVDVASLQTTIQALAQTIHDTNPMLDSLARLTSKDFPAAIQATQTSLASAQSSALLIDNTLGALTNIPFLPMTAYKPAVPLHTALADISTSLDPLTPAMATISASLVDGKTNMAGVETELKRIADTTKEIGSALTDSQAVIRQYKTVTSQLKERVQAAQLSAANWITITAWILSLGLAWLMIAQLGLCAQGYDMLQVPLMKTESNATSNNPTPDPSQREGN